MQIPIRINETPGLRKTFNINLFKSLNFGFIDYIKRYMIVTNIRFKNIFLFLKISHLTVFRLNWKNF